MVGAPGYVCNTYTEHVLRRRKWTARVVMSPAGFWEYFECGVHVSIGEHDRYYADPEEEDPYHRSNILFGCLTAANGLRNSFVLVQISRFQQIIGVYTLQAPSEAAKVGTISCNFLPLLEIKV